jgi:cytochrome d ubiquinol oxidase subunit II
MDPSALETVWFLLIAVLWIGYFVLEGFDFGVGILLPVLGRDDVDRRVIINTIGPVWDGNEVWLLTAGGATFAAFPEWYATLFSGFYVPLLLILLALIVRGVAFEFRGKHDTARWRGTWDAAIFVGSVVPALLWGVAFANVVRGVSLTAEGEYAGSFWDLLSPYALLGGLATLLLFLAHGTVFLSLRTEDEMRERARRAGDLALPAAAVVGAGFIVWTIVRAADRSDLVASTVAAGIVAAIAAVAALALHRARRDGWAFAASAVAIGFVVLMLFAALWPNVLNALDEGSPALSIAEAASTSYTLTVMTVVAALLTPVVLAYTAWTYWVFRRRIGRGDFGDVRTPADLLARRARGADADG